jgi:hypothetical protein
MKRYAFTRAHARGLVWMGWTVCATCLVVGAMLTVAGTRGSLAEYFTGKGYAAAAAGLLAVGVILIVSALAGVVLATPFIVAGHSILIALDQRAIAARHLRTAKRIHRAVRPRPPDDVRVSRRRVI